MLSVESNSGRSSTEWVKLTLDISPSRRSPRSRRRHLRMCVFPDSQLIDDHNRSMGTRAISMICLSTTGGATVDEDKGFCLSRRGDHRGYPSGDSRDTRKTPKILRPRVASSQARRAFPHSMHLNSRRSTVWIFSAYSGLLEFFKHSP